MQIHAIVQSTEACIYKSGPKNGVIFLFDMNGGKVGHVFQPSISSLRKLLKLVEFGCPFKIRAIHVINTAPFMNLVIGNNDAK